MLMTMQVKHITNYSTSRLHVLDTSPCSKFRLIRLCYPHREWIIESWESED